MLAPFWSLPFCFFLLFLACFPPSGLRACWLARFWLSVACVVLSGSLSAVCGSYLLGWASLAVGCLRCPAWLVSCRLWFVPAGSGVSGCCLPALSCLARFRGRLRFLPAWLGVSGCYLPALSSLARFLPSLVCTCLVGCSGCCLPVLPCPARFRRSAVPTCLAGRLWLVSRRLWFVPACLRVSGRRARLLFSFFWLASHRFSVVPAWSLLPLRPAHSDRSNHRAVSEPAVTGSQNKKRVFLNRPAAPENAKPACY